MKNFLKNIFVFLVITIIIGEIVVRFTHAVSDIPQRTIDDYGIQKYLPNQKGYWKGGDHQWIINEYGWPGESPSNFDNLFVIIGDSFIENFMNPNNCHQSHFLKELLPEYNFFEAGRSGVSLIEAMEISKELDTLSPLSTLIYVNDNDFTESVYNITPLKDITQLDLKTNQINHGEINAALLKKILYNWKLMYYLYNRFYITKPANKTVKSTITIDDNSSKNIDSNIAELLIYIKTNYVIEDKVLVFHPNSNIRIIELCKKLNFKVITLNSKEDKSWTFDYDKHWNCYGHKKAAFQVFKNLSL